VLTLTLRQQPDVPLELDGVTPDRLAGSSLGEVSKRPVFHGNRRVDLGDFFAATGSPAGGDVRIVGDCSRVKLLGAGMTGGTLTIDGPAGWHAGARMSGGALEILGDAGHWLAAEMTGGMVTVRGNAGHQCAAAYRGSLHGLRGGTVVVRGDCGDEAGLRMRRGMLAVGGAAGAAAAAGMVAGTLVALGGVGPMCGSGMKRGTVVVRGPEPAWPAGVRHSCDARPAYLDLLTKWLAESGLPVAFDWVARCFRGDLIHGGRGELWHLPG
jgi:formylmethanofuran dehydrogenase subunit C